MTELEKYFSDNTENLTAYTIKTREQALAAGCTTTRDYSFFTDGKQTYMNEVQPKIKEIIKRAGREVREEGNNKYTCPDGSTIYAPNLETAKRRCEQ